MLIELGQKLFRARENKGLSLEAVATPSRISSAYLHKLERGVVDSPSPRVLARIAAVLDISYLDLMQSAGYLDEAQLTDARLRELSPKPHPLAGRQLTQKEWKEVGAFIKNLVAQRKPKRAKDDSAS